MLYTIYLSVPDVQHHDVVELDQGEDENEDEGENDEGEDDEGEDGEDEDEDTESDPPPPPPKKRQRTGATNVLVHHQYDVTDVEHNSSIILFHEFELPIFLCRRACSICICRVETSR